MQKALEVTIVGIMFHHLEVAAVDVKEICYWPNNAIYLKQGVKGYVIVLCI